MPLIVTNTPVPAESAEAIAETVDPEFEAQVKGVRKEHVPVKIFN